MRSTNRVLVFVALLLLSECAVAADELAKAREALAGLKIDLQKGRIARVDVFFISYFTAIPMRVTPQLLEPQAQRKASGKLGAELVVGLIEAIDGTELHLDDGESDLRWGAVFLDQFGTRLHAIYLNSYYFSSGAGRRGYIDGIPVRLNSSLITWFETNFYYGYNRIK